jgi:7-carboxy-7-deazaguanine synthase
MSASQIVQFARDAGTRHLTLTGGEPLLQPDLPALVEGLLSLPGLSVEIETNGALPLDPLAQLRSRMPEAQRNRLAFTLDCKLPSSGMADRMLAGNYQLLMPHDTVKFVVGNEGDFAAALQVITAHALAGRCLVYLSPVHGQMEPAALVDLMRANGLVDATLQLQLHKIIWPHAQKGV